jgi:PAS domain S-box-containing protein
MPAPETIDRDPTTAAFDFLYEHAPCGYISFKPDGSITNINTTLLKWLLYDRKEDVYQKKFRQILTKAGEFYCQMIVLPLVNMQGAVSEINFDIQSADGASFPSLFNAVTEKDEAGKVKAIHACIIKIADRKKYEAELLNEKKQATEEKKRFEFLANIIPNLIFTADYNGKIDFLNARFYEYFDFSKNSLLQNSFLTFIHYDDRVGAARSWIKVLKRIRDLMLR